MPVDAVLVGTAAMATLARALGRTPGNPLHVISQKTVTGHAKGGAAVFQTAGLLEVFRDQVIPGNASLDCLAPAMRDFAPLLWPRRPLDLSASPVRAAFLTSLGFGHVSALVALAHPSAFEARLAVERGEDGARVWRERAQERLRAGRVRLERGMMGRAVLALDEGSTVERVNAGARPRPPSRGVPRRPLGREGGRRQGLVRPHDRAGPADPPRGARLVRDRGRPRPVAPAPPPIPRAREGPAR